MICLTANIFLGGEGFNRRLKSFVRVSLTLEYYIEITFQAKLHLVHKIGSNRKNINVTSNLNQRCTAKTTLVCVVAVLLIKAELA